MSARNYQLLFDKMLNGFALHEIILDESGAPCDYRFLEVNPAFEALTGLKRAQIIGRTVREVLPDIEPHWIETYGRVALSGEPTHFESYSAPLDKYFEGQAYCPQRGQFVAVFTDITERKRLEQALADERNLLRTLIDAIPDHVYVKDSESRYLLVNRATANNLGFDDPAEIVGKGMSDLFPPRLEQEYRHNDLQVIQTGQPIHIEEALVTRGDEPRVGWTVKVPLRDEQGQVIGLVGLSRDITERKRLEEQLRQSQKMEAIGALAGGIAHNFNNLLTAVIGFAEFALSELPPGSLAAQDIQRVLAGSQQMAELTRWLLAFARRQTLRPVEVNLNELLARFEKVLTPALGQHVALNLRLSPDLWPVKVDPAQIEQVLLNLALNAQRAMSGGGQFTIETANLTLSSAAAPEERPGMRSTQIDLPPGDYVRLAASDTGCGMDAETLPRLFEPFFTTKGLAEATGLGLAATYGIIKQHGGDIRAMSAPGRGARFEIYLPRAR